MNRITLLLAGAALLAGTAAAQDSAAQDHVRTFTFTQNDQAKGLPPDFNFMLQRNKVPEDGIVTILGAEMASPGETVTGSPYTATAITETTQTLADGNKIVNKTSSFVARDSQGRTRREDSVGRIGSLQGSAQKMIFINDPTNHTQYISQSGGESSTIVRNNATWSSAPKIIQLDGGQSEMRHKTIVKTFKTDGEKQSQDTDNSNVKHEELGTQTIEGVSAEGKRDTLTIPAGQIGNERAIEVVTETWYSPDLHTMVMRKHSDPRVGDTVFHLTEIKRNEPDASLFQAPAGTKIDSLPELKQRMAHPKD
jgi:hypothetical protein